MEKRRDSKRFGYYLLTALVLMFVAIVSELARDTAMKPEVMTAMVGFAGTILGLIGLIVNNEWGSSKGSAQKDQMLAAKSSPPEPPTGPTVAIVATAGTPAPGQPQ